MTRRRLESLARVWRRHLVARAALSAVGGACLVGAAAWVCTPFPSFAALAALATILAWRLAVDQPWRFDAAQLSWHLDRAYPELEESSALWLRAPEELTVLERLQRRRADDALARTQAASDAQVPFAAPPRAWLRNAAWRVAACAAVLLLTLFGLPRKNAGFGVGSAAPARADARGKNVGAEPGKNAPSWPRILRAELVISPPAYTRRPERQAAGFNAEAEEGARLTWRLELDQPARDVKLIGGEGAGQADPFHETAPQHYELRQTARETALNRLSGTLPDGTAWNPPEIYSLKVRKDLPPSIRVMQPAPPRTEIEPPAATAEDAAKPLTVTVEALADDDYAVADARLVLTVAKGSGEAVKFREQSAPFDSSGPARDEPPDAPTAATARRFVKTLDLRALGMEPGDELYFYAEASDNHPPTPNRNRSETRFIVLKGPKAKPAAAGRGVSGVNLVPQYFRSQRQIIIDTEKLLADRPHLAEEEFRRRANDLGIDQQLLRLRYGQFLGEELEEGQGSGDHQEVALHPLQPGVPAGVPADLVHRHDTAPTATGGADPRAGARTALRLKLEHEEQARGGDHNEGGKPSDGTPPTPGQIVAPFVDQHDKQDEATFFDHETKSTLRDALAAMWQAEGFLRTARPQEALAPENVALTILKDLQQSARAYVQRVGFEPPPLREKERRLKGDVSDVAERQAAAYAPPTGDEALGQVRAALRAAPWIGTNRASSSESAETLRRVAPILTEAATREPERFLAGLQALRQMLAADSAAAPEQAAALEQALLRLLPAADARPIRAVDPAPAEADAYFRALAQPPASAP